MSHCQQLNVAVLQTAPRKGAPDENRARALEALRRATDAGARLIALPECAISGYAISTASEAFDLAEEVTGPTTQAFHRHCVATGAHVVFGLLEREGGSIFNSAVLVGPEGVLGRHRKAHFVPVGADQFIAPGTSLEVFEALGIRIGMLICYEIRFPEICRVMALKGAQLLVVAANWPAGADVNPDIMTPARAAENNVHVLAANRCGTEGAFSFIGKSAIIAPSGRPIVCAGVGEEAIAATIEIGNGLGELPVAESGYVVDLRRNRRPDLYENLARKEQC